MKVKAEGRRSQVTRRWRMKRRRRSSSSSSSSQELDRQQEEGLVLRRWLWRRGSRHHLLKPVCRVVCQGETQNFISESTFLSRAVICFSSFQRSLFTDRFCAMTAAFVSTSKTWCMNIIELSFRLSPCSPNVYYYVFPLSVPQCHHCWHSPLSLLSLYILHKHLQARRMLNLNCSWQESKSNESPCKGTVYFNVLLLQ